MSSRTERLPAWDSYLNTTSRQGLDSGNLGLVGWCNLWNMDSYYLSIEDKVSSDVSAITLHRELELFSDLADLFAEHH